MHYVLCVRAHNSITRLSHCIYACLSLFGVIPVLAKVAKQIKHVTSKNGVFCYLSLKGKTSTLYLFREKLLLKICTLCLLTKISTLLHLFVYVANHANLQCIISWVKMIRFRDIPASKFPFSYGALRFREVVFSFGAGVVVGFNLYWHALVRNRLFLRSTPQLNAISTGLYKTAKKMSIYVD